MQQLNQAHMKVLQSIKNRVAEASTIVAKEKKLSMIVHDEVCFFQKSSADVTSSIIKEMDKNYQKENPPVAAQVETDKK